MNASEFLSFFEENTPNKNLTKTLKYDARVHPSNSSTESTCDSANQSEDTSGMSEHATLFGCLDDCANRKAHRCVMSFICPCLIWARIMNRVWSSSSSSCFWVSFYIFSMPLLCPLCLSAQSRECIEESVTDSDSAGCVRSCLVHCFCHCCALSQESRVLDVLEELECAASGSLNLSKRPSRMMFQEKRRHSAPK